MHITDRYTAWGTSGDSVTLSPVIWLERSDGQRVSHDGDLEDRDWLAAQSVDTRRRPLAATVELINARPDIESRVACVGAGACHVVIDGQTWVWLASNPDELVVFGRQLGGYYAEPGARKWVDVRERVESVPDGYHYPVGPYGGRDRWGWKEDGVIVRNNPTVSA
jgi:hypothetical protein